MIPVDDPPPLALTDLVPFPDQTITDTELSFRNAIARYTLLEQAAFSLLIDLQDLPPRQILLRSRQLAQMQQDLARQDDQLIAILTLAGPEIVTNPFIQDYRHILVQVSLIFAQIREQTATIKKNIPTDSTTHRNLDSSCQD